MKILATHQAGGYFLLMANVSPKTQDKSFTMRADAEFFDAVDELRSLMKPVPSKSDAVRIAVFNELERWRKGEKKK